MTKNVAISRIFKAQKCISGPSYTRQRSLPPDRLAGFLGKAVKKEVEGKRVR